MGLQTACAWPFLWGMQTACGLQADASTQALWHAGGKRAGESGRAPEKMSKFFSGAPKAGSNQGKY
jgi:uncharacterized membrane protein